MKLPLCVGSCRVKIYYGLFDHYGTHTKRALFSQKVNWKHSLHKSTQAIKKWKFPKIGSSFMVEIILNKLNSIYTFQIRRCFHRDPTRPKPKLVASISGTGWLLNAQNSDQFTADPSNKVFGKLRHSLELKDSPTWPVS